LESKVRDLEKDKSRLESKVQDLDKDKSRLAVKGAALAYELAGARSKVESKAAECKDISTDRAFYLEKCQRAEASLAFGKKQHAIEVAKLEQALAEEKKRLSEEQEVHELNKRQLQKTASEISGLKKQLADEKQAHERTKAELSHKDSIYKSALKHWLKAMSTTGPPAKRARVDP